MAAEGGQRTGRFAAISATSARDNRPAWSTGESLPLGCDARSTGRSRFAARRHRSSTKPPAIFAIQILLSHTKIENNRPLSRRRHRRRPDPCWATEVWDWSSPSAWRWALRSWTALRL